MSALKTLPQDGVKTIFTAHSLPVQSLRVDDYVEKINASIEAVVKGLTLDWTLAYQSRGGGAVEWLGPSAEDAIKIAKDKGHKAVCIVPIGFCSDHVETLYDIDILFKDIAEGSGLAFARAASLNTNRKFIAMLADVVEQNI